MPLSRVFSALQLREPLGPVAAISVASIRVPHRALLSGHCLVPPKLSLIQPPRCTLPIFAPQRYDQFWLHLLFSASGTLTVHPIQCTLVVHEAHCGTPTPAQL